MGTAIKHPLPDRVKTASECLDVKNYEWRLNPVWNRMLCSCTHMATVEVKFSHICPSFTHLPIFPTCNLSHGT